MKYQTILFDLDGTLTNPQEGITKSFAYALSYYGIEVDDLSSLNFVIGPPLTASFREHYGFSEEKAREAADKYRERFSDVGWAENEVYEGIPEMLSALVEAGLKLIVATSKPEHFAVRIMEHFGLTKYFCMVCGADATAQFRSTKEEVLRYALSENGVTDLSKVVMVGDRKYDVEGALALGIQTIGVLFGFGDREELSKAGAAALVASPKELAEYLLQ